MDNNKNGDALNDVRRKISEVLNKEDKKLVFGWRGETAPTLKEGETWTDSTGKTWTMKNGVRQTVTKLDTAKTPWWCPKCSKPMNGRFDKRFWGTRGYCFDCHIKVETEIRRLGKWEEYERNLMFRNYVAKVKDTIAELENNRDTVKELEFINADETRILMMEKWNVDVDKVKQEITEEIEKLQVILQQSLDENPELVATLDIPLREYVESLIQTGE